MTDREILQGMMRREPLRQMGIDDRLYRGFGLRAQTAGQESVIMRQPVVDTGALQNEEGAPYFMVDFDDPTVAAPIL